MKPYSETQHPAKVKELNEWAWDGTSSIYDPEHPSGADIATMNIHTAHFTDKETAWRARLIESAPALYNILVELLESPELDMEVWHDRGEMDEFTRYAIGTASQILNYIKHG